MHSRFRVTNSSDRLGLDVGVPQVRGITKAFWEFKISMTNNMSLIRMASNAAMVTVKSSQVYRVPPVSQGNQGERSQHEKKGQEELRSGTARALAVISLNMLLYSPSLQALLGTKASLSKTSALS